MLVVHRAERADALAAALADLLRHPPDDPLAPELVAVPARGVERWLTQRLSHTLGASPGGRDGVCAHVEFPSPTQLLARVDEAVLGLSDDPWASGRLVWPLLELMESGTDEPWHAPLAARTGTAADRPGRRFVTAQRLARLFDSYRVQRPRLLRDWAAGTDSDGAGSVLAAELTWQAELFRRLRQRLGANPAERLDELCAAIRTDPARLDLPPRLSLFGPTRLTRDQLAVLTALAADRDVHLWLPHPSPAAWQRVADLPSCGVPRRRADPAAALVAHPLLASLGRDVREVQLLLADAAPNAADQHHPLPDRVESRPLLLHRLQASLRDDALPEPIALDPDDRSLVVHACHGRGRQVEVLREVLLGLLAADPTLEPRDVLVMCPDVEEFAPLIAAVFGLGEDADGGDDELGHPGQRLRVRVADRSLRQTNPLFGVVGELLELVAGRVTASQVLDFAALAPVRRRFGFDDEELELLRDWVARSGVRWGLDAKHRAPYGLPVPHNTWSAGLDRLLVGAAMADTAGPQAQPCWWGDALPFGDVDSNDVDLVGRLAELLSRLATALNRLTNRQPLADWLGALTESVAALAAVADSDGWQLAQLRRELADVADEAGIGAGGRGPLLELADLRALLADRLSGRPTRANFRTGHLTVASLVPMRSVPHRVVCLLGLDDGVFPRHPIVDGDDVLARDPCVGERDRRSEDRQLFLDALLAAREYLVLLYSGADERTNASRPPAVPVGELLDAVDALARTNDGRPAREHVVVRHPLQPFDPRNFIPGALGRRGPFSFDRPTLAGARALREPRREMPPFLAAPLPPGQRNPVELDELLRFFDHPVRGFLRQRLVVTVLGEQEQVSDAMPVELDGLARWSVGERLLQARLAGQSLDDCWNAEKRRGVLPPYQLGSRIFGQLAEQVERLVAAAQPVRDEAARPVDVAVPLADGRLLTGTLAGVHGQRLVAVRFARLAPKHRLRAWIGLLAGTAARPDLDWTAVTIGRGGSEAACCAFAAPEPAQARAWLEELVDLYDRGLREPLPLPSRTSWQYAWDRARGKPAGPAARDAAREWEKSREHEDPEHVLVWGPKPSFDLLLADPPRDDECGDGWASDEPHRFGVLARRLWTPLLTAERSGS